MAYNTYIENYNMAVRQARGLKTKLPVTLSGSTATINVGGTLTAYGSTASTTTAAGTPKAVALMSDGIGIYVGSGTPNAVVTAPKGSLFINTGGSSTSTRLYVNTDGATAWTNFTSAA
jgi:hypothetical protein